MNTTNSSPRLLLALCLIAAFLVTPTRATTIKDFYAIPEQRQLDFLAQKINDMCDKLRSPYDSKGNRKSIELLEKQKELAQFTIQLFETRDSTGIRASYFKLGSLIYSAYLDDPLLSVERTIQVFVTERYKEKLAADAAAKAEQGPSSSITSKQVGK